MAATQVGWWARWGAACQSVGFPFEPKEKKGGASHTEADDCFVHGVNQRPSLSSANGEHSLQGVLQNALFFIIDRVLVFFFFFLFYFFFLHFFCRG